MAQIHLEKPILALAHAWPTVCGLEVRCRQVSVCVTDFYIFISAECKLLIQQEFASSSLVAERDERAFSNSELSEDLLARQIFCKLSAWG